MKWGEYTEAQVFGVFSNDYLLKHGTLNGVRDEFSWWKNPLQKCAIQHAARGGNRCNRICEFCANRMNGANRANK